MDPDVLSLDGEGVGDVRSASRRKRSRPDGVPRRASWGDRGGHWEAIVLGEVSEGWWNQVAKEKGVAYRGERRPSPRPLRRSGAGRTSRAPFFVYKPSSDEKRKQRQVSGCNRAEPRQGPSYNDCQFK